MAINFNQNSVFNLTPMDVNGVRTELDGLLVDGESVQFAFKTIRDQLVFTNKRIVSIDVQGITGKRKSFSSMPYSKIQFFTIQTSGFLELIPDSELLVEFTNGFEAKFEFKRKTDIGMIGRMISEYVL